MDALISGKEQDAYLARRFAEIREEYSGAIALYGAGAHTRRLLRTMKDGLERLAFILDDMAMDGDELMGYRVVRPQDADPSEVVAVVISSDQAEEAIFPRAQQWVRTGGDHARVIRLYQGVEIKHIVKANQEESASGHGFDGAYQLDQVFQDEYDRSLEASGCEDQTKRRARFYNLTSSLRLTHGLGGATAEAGCHRGQSSYLLCCEILRKNPGFDGCGHSVFDSFEGFARPRDLDGEYSHQRYCDEAFADTSVEHVRGTLREFPGVEIYKGWIPSVFSKVENIKYRFVHIDVDLYDPTLDSLEYFYPKLVPGGVLVVDDYCTWPTGIYCGCAIACKEFARKHDLGFAPLNTGNALFIKR